MMEIMDSAKMGVDSSAENTPNFILPICSIGMLLKKGFMGGP